MPQVQGAVTTYNKEKRDPNLVLPLTEEEIKERTFTHDEIKGFLGDLKPGEIGYLELDENGTPTGAAIKEEPEPGNTFIRVVATAPLALDEVVTPSGAPVTKHMNPDPDFGLDEAFYERNPPDGNWTAPEGNYERPDRQAKREQHERTERALDHSDGTAQPTTGATVEGGQHE